MIFKNGKDAALAAISSSVYISVCNSLSSCNGWQLENALKQTISEAVTAGIREMLNQQYTDSDFERDIQLKT